MKLFTIIILITGITLLVGEEKKQLTVEDIYGSTKFSGKKLREVYWLPDSAAFTYLEGNPDTKLSDIYLYNISMAEKKMILEGSSIKYKGEPIWSSSYEWSPNQKYLLISGPKKKIWRRSGESSYYIYDLDNKTVTAIANENASIQYAKISPDGNSAAYMLDNNLFVADIKTGKAKALTLDGNSDILNGVFDWVYEEEFSSADAWHWSPDGKKIAFWRLDQTNVKPFIYMLDQLPRYNVAHTIKYPKVGETNSTIKIGVVDIKTGRITWMDLGEECDIYIPRIEWTNSSNTLGIERLNRKQNKLELLFADVSSGKTKLILTDTDPAWVDVTDDLHFMKDKDQFIWTSEKSGFRHIYLYNYDGNLIKQLTTGDWEVESVEGVDEVNCWVYFHGMKETPLEKQIYRVKLDGSNLQKISQQNGWHVADFSPDFQYYIDTFSNAKTPTKYFLSKSDGRIIHEFESYPIGVLDEYQMVYPEFLTFKTSDGMELNAYMIKPVDFDSHKKYPVLVYAYGMPGVQEVTNEWNSKRELWHILMAERGFMVFCMDDRCTGGRGKALKNLAHGDISKWIIHDQIEGAKYLADLPYVDASRIGIWGWSGGGFTTCHLMTRAADYFKVGVAVSPVTDFRNYDTIWTERYMGLLNENEKGYENVDVLNYANLLKGKLLLIHGSGDDNVHFQNTVQLIQKLSDEGKQFDLMIYPNKSHSISGENTQVHLFTKITNYFLDNL